MSKKRDKNTIARTRKTTNARNVAKARRPVTRNGNDLTDTIRNTRQEEGAKAIQPNCGSRPSPPYLRSTCLSLQVKCE